MLCPFICMWAFRLLPHLGYVNNSTVNVGVQMSLWDSAFSSCGHTLRIDIAGFYGSYILNFLRNCSALCQQLHSFTVLPTVCKSSCFSISSSELLFSVLGFFLVFLFVCFWRAASYYSWDDMSLWVICRVVSLMINDVEHLFMLIDHLYIFFG